MSADQLKERVQKIMPELEINHFERIDEGLINDVAIVNQELVFRFAKNDGFAQILNLELDILDLVRPHLNIQIPTPVYRGPGSVVYPLVPGQALLRKTLLALGPSAQEKTADQLGAFLRQLHGVDLTSVDWELPSTMAPVTRRKWVELKARMEEKVYPLLLKHQITWVEDLFASVMDDPEAFTYTPRLIHGDLVPSHILFNPEQELITGIIDFGVSGLGDPALDIGTLITNYGERFVQKMSLAYPEMTKLIRRARFYAQAIELQWVLLGLETGDNFWFTAHLGSARDVQG
ncbi:MAG: phosphotransferase [Anaerolineales bacterium]|nr:phosphotransferase [Anaerolineales bacterium]